MKLISLKKRNITIFVIPLTITTLFFACVAGMANIGSNKRSEQARDKIESLQVLPDYNYYYIGSNVHPDALIAIHKNYTLSEGIWEKVDPTGKAFSSMVKDMQKSDAKTPHGYYILDPQGKLIGIYYSHWDPWPPHMEGGNKVGLPAPDKEESIKTPRLGL